MEIRKTFWVCLILLGVNLFLSIWTGAKIYSRLFFLLLFVILISFLLTLFSVRGFFIKRSARVLRQSVGQVFVEQFEVLNTLPIFRIWLEILDECSMIAKTGSRVISWIGPKQKRNYVSYSHLYQRGLFHLGPTKITSGDPLGLFRVSKLIPARQSLIVLPYMVDLLQFPSPYGLLTGGRVIGRRTFEVTPQAASVREYVAGDPLNRIHWLTTVRRNRLMVKEFEQDPRADVWVFLDACQISHSEIRESDRYLDPEKPFWSSSKEEQITLPSNSFEYAVSISGSITNFFIRHGRAVGLASVGQTMTLLPAERGERQQTRILETLAHLKNEGRMDLSVLIEAQAPVLPRGSTIVIVTTSDSPKVEESLNNLLMRSLKPIVILLSSDTFGGKRNAEDQIVQIVQNNIPVVTIRNHDDLQHRLENGFSIQFQNTVLNEYSFSR